MNQRKLRMNVESIGVASFATTPRMARPAFPTTVPDLETKIVSCNPDCTTPSSPPPCTPFPPIL